MPTAWQSFVASLTRLYPLYSGCGTLANSKLFCELTGISSETVWSKVPGGEVIARLDDFVGRSAFYMGDLDPKITWICKQIVRPGDTVLDIGANIGMVTIRLSALVGPKGKVHAFEPNPRMQNVLDQTFARNLNKNVYLHRIALGALEGSLELIIPQHNAGAASLTRNRGIAGCESVTVPVRTLSKIAEEHNISSARLIKIDVEGFEAEVLRGGTTMIKSLRPAAILFELNEIRNELIRDQPVISILRELNYTFFAIPKCILRMHLQRFDLNSDDQLNTHDFLAVHQNHCAEIAKLVKAAA